MSLLLFAGGRVVAASPSYTEVSASLTRYDSTDGEALFRGTIPFAPGVIATESDLDNVRLLVNGSEPSGGLWIEPLMGTHADGSIKVAYVEFTATCGSAETVPCTVRIGQARSTADRSALVDAVQRAPLSWCRQPTLFFVTDADYRVAARLAPLPLITMAQAEARLPAAWITAMTTGIDSKFPPASPYSGTASYNINYAILCLAEMAGNPARVHSALSHFVPETVSNSGHTLDFYTPASGNYVPEIRLGDNPSSNTFGIPAEWYDAGPTTLMAYWHTGSKQMETCLELTGASFPTVRFSSAYGMRYNVRWFFQRLLVGRLLGQTRTIQSLAGGWTYNPTALATPDVIDGYLDLWDGGVATLTPANGVPAWAEGYTLWGWSSTSWAAGEIPTFQISTILWPLMAAYLRFAQDPRIPLALDSCRAFLDTQLIEHTITDGGGHTAYRHSYLPNDPADLATDDGTGNTSYDATSFFLSTMFGPLYAFAYARDNTDTDAATKADRLIDVKMYDRAATNGGGGVINQTKLVGEWFFMTPHAAAWRAGVPWNGWEIPT